MTFDELWDNKELWMYRAVRDACEYAFNAGQASAEQRVLCIEEELDQSRADLQNASKVVAELENELDLLKHAPQIVEALKAQAGEPVAWMLCYQGQMPYFVYDEQEIPDDKFVAITPLYTHPTTERPYNPLNDYAIISMTPTTKRRVIPEWQPIETAPKTGREMILLLTPSNWPQVAWSNTWWTSGFSVECKPTHWMPLPAAPTDIRS